MSLKILNSRQIREADAYTIAQEKITSSELMERASAAFVRAFVKMYDEKKEIFVFCGTGNNGGDGLVIARLLLSQNYKVTVYVLRENGKSSEDFLKNLEKLTKFHEPKEVRQSADIPDIAENTVVVDALFGTGLSRPITGLYKQVIDKINDSVAEVVSVDIPSGLYTDAPADPDGAIVQSDCVLTFHNPKLALVLPENGRWVRAWKIVNIGLSKEYIAQAESAYRFTDLDTIRKIYKSRDKWAHKGDFGKVLLIAGSKGKIGAGVLCAKACMRSGVGLLTVYLPACGYDIMQVSLPEAMVQTDPSVEYLTLAPDMEHYDVVGVGPGLGTSPSTAEAFGEILKGTGTKRPIVFDADALNLLSCKPELLDLLPEKAVLTPHPKEFERLAGPWKNDFERLQKQMEFSKKHQVVVVLKGAHTSIASPDGRVYFNSTGNPGMATAGAGDVLTGIIAGILGQKYEPFEAAILGVFLHGLAADLVAKDLGEDAVIASDLIDYLPKAYLEIKNPALSIAPHIY